MSEKFHNQDKSEFTKLKSFLKSVKEFDTTQSYQQQFEKLFNSDTYTRPKERFTGIIATFVEKHYAEIVVILAVMYGYTTGMTQGYITKRGKVVQGHEYLKTANGVFVSAWDGNYYEKTRVKIKGDTYDRYELKTTAGDVYYLYISKYIKNNDVESFVSADKQGEEE